MKVSYTYTEVWRKKKLKMVELVPVEMMRVAMLTIKNTLAP